MENEGIVDHARRIGAEAIGPALGALAEKHRLIGEVRGEGVFWAIELVSDRETREPVGADVIGRLKKELSSRGLMPFAADNRIHVVPPCVVTDDEVAQAMSIYDEALTSVEEDLS
jgi:taurine--2-oxoglutarate transaminase